MGGEIIAAPVLVNSINEHMNKLANVERLNAREKNSTNLRIYTNVAHTGALICVHSNKFEDHHDDRLAKSS
jgi:hypothetical protein